jgi:YbgC/YbaW family acyl-CoA thioester hydrolase
MGALTCPFCDAGDTETVGQWGGQMITAQWRCRACNSYFEAIREEFAGAPASITIRRRIEWIDTDAAGIYHWTTAFRLAEAAEAELHTALGFADVTFGATPRVAVSADFRSSLRFNDVVEVTLRVERVGRTSVEYSLAITGPDGPAVEGRLTACFIDRETRRATPWPPEIRRLLAGD